MLNRCYGMVMSVMFLCGVLSQVYVPLPDVQVYFFECAFFTVILMADAMYRKASFSSTLAYGLASLVLAPLAVPHWFANRPLKPGECRKGGVDANFFNAFALLTVAYTGASAACNFLSYGPEHGFELIVNSGFAVAGTALVMALITRQEQLLETGRKRLPKGVEEAE